VDVLAHGPDDEDAVGVDEDGGGNDSDRKTTHNTTRSTAGHASRDEGAGILPEEDKGHKEDQIDEEGEADVVEVDADLGFETVSHSIPGRNDQRQANQKIRCIARLQCHINFIADGWDLQDNIAHGESDEEQGRDKVDAEDDLRAKGKTAAAATLIHGTHHGFLMVNNGCVWKEI